MKNEALLLMRALEACARRDTTGAIRAFRRLVKRHPFRNDYRVALADLLYQEEMFAPAVAAYRKALQLLRQGKARCPPGLDGPDRAVNADGGGGFGEARLRFALGGALAAAGDDVGAEANLRRAIELDPCARHLVGLGSRLELRGGRAEALALYERAVLEEPGYAEAHYRVGSWHMWLDAGRAEAGMRRTVELDETHATAWSALGLLLGQRKAWEEADRCLGRAIRLGSAGALPHVYRGHHAWHRGRLRKAETAYRAGMRADPGDPHPIFSLGDLFRHEERTDDAQQAYEAALRLDPRCADAALRLAWLHDDEGRPDVAVPLFRRGLLLAPEHPWEEEVRERLSALEAGEGSAS